MSCTILVPREEKIMDPAGNEVSAGDARAHRG